MRYQMYIADVTYTANYCPNSFCGVGESVDRIILVNEPALQVLIQKAITPHAEERSGHATLGHTEIISPNKVHKQHTI